VRGLVLALLLLAAAGTSRAQIVNPSTITPVWIHGIASVVCTDGHAGAPSGAVAEFPTLLNGYAFAGPCQWPDVNYGIGATGLGTPAVTNATTSTGSTVLHFASVPGYVANGQSVVDLNQLSGVSAIPQLDTVQSFTSTTVTILTAPNSTIQSGDHIAFFTTAANYSFPGGVTLDGVNHFIRINASNITLTGLDSTGYIMRCDSSCVNPTINNVYCGVENSPLVDCFNATVNASGGGTITNSTFNGNRIVDGASTGYSVLIAGTGNWTITYLKCVNEATTCVGTNLNSGTSGSMTEEYSGCINPGASFPAGGHDNCVEIFGGTMQPTFQHNLVLMNYSQNDGMESVFNTGDNFDLTFSPSPVFNDNLVFLPLVPITDPTYGLTQVTGVCRGFLAAVPTGETYNCTNNKVLPTGINLAFTGLSNPPVPSVVMTASISGTLLTVTGSPTGTIQAHGQYLDYPGVVAGTTVVSAGSGTGGAGTYNLSTNNGAVSSQSMNIWDGAYFANPGTYVDTGNVNISTGAPIN